MHGIANCKSRSQILTTGSGPRIPPSRQRLSWPSFLHRVLGNLHPADYSGHSLVWSYLALYSGAFLGVFALLQLEVAALATSGAFEEMDDDCIPQSCLACKGVSFTSSLSSVWASRPSSAHVSYGSYFCMHMYNFLFACAISLCHEPPERSSVSINAYLTTPHTGPICILQQPTFLFSLDGTGVLIGLRVMLLEVMAALVGYDAWRHLSDSGNLGGGVGWRTV